MRRIRPHAAALEIEAAGCTPGLGPSGLDLGKGVSETEWRSFLDKEVTLRFPAGLSVMDLYGQWQGKGEAQPGSIRSGVAD